MKAINNNLIPAQVDLAGNARLILSRGTADFGLGFQAMDRVRFAAGASGLRERKCFF
jgi:hypothetical protein